MATGGVQYTASQKTAMDFAWSAASTGLTQSGGLAAYREGGGAIRDSAWAQIYKEAFSTVGWRENIKSIPKHWTVPEAMFGGPRHDWGMRFNYIAEVEVYSQAEKDWITKHVQVQSDELMSKGDWRSLVEEALETTSPEGVYAPGLGVKFITEEAVRWARD